MGILIVIVILTIVIAAIGAGIYVVIFRAKHKKEVMANSQMNNAVPNYGAGNIMDQPAQTQAPSPMFSASPPQGQNSPVMNDIVLNGSAPQNTFASDVPQAPVQEAAPELPTVDHSFPGNELAQPEPLVSDMVASSEPVDQEPASPVNTLDLNQPEAALQGESDMMKAVENANVTPETDASLAGNFTVPVTKVEDVPVQPEASLGDVLTPESVQAPVDVPAAVPEMQVESPAPVQEPTLTPESAPLETPVEAPYPVQEPTFAQEPAPQETPMPEVPQPPVFTAPTDVPAPQPPIENAMPVDVPSPQPVENTVPVPDSTSEEDTGTKEMHI